jgi:hypothetical protein
MRTYGPPNKRERRKKMDPKVKDITLLLIYLTSWPEDSKKELGKKVLRAWKGYEFELLDELEDANLIRQFSKSLILTAEGKLKAEGLKKQYLGS